MTTRVHVSTGPSGCPAVASPDSPAAGPTRRLTRLPWTRIALVWLTVYTGLRLYWAAGNAPDPDLLSAVGTDLVGFTGWASVALCGAGLVAVLAQLAVRPAGARGHLTAALGWAVAAGLASASAMLLLDVVGGVLPGLGIEFHPLGAASRAACAGCAVLVGGLTLGYHRRVGLRRAGPLDRTPGWAYAAAYLAVAGFVVRLGAQLWVGLDENPLMSGPSALLFELGFVLAGAVLPLALVHRWGRVWPRWTMFLRGRAVPRRLVLWSGAGLGAGMTTYFGFMVVIMVWERLNGRNPFPPSGGLDLPESFFWFSVPAYLIWGVGLVVASWAYARRTRPTTALAP